MHQSCCLGLRSSSLILGVFGLLLLPGCPVPVPCEANTDCSAGQFCNGGGFCTQAGGNLDSCDPDCVDDDLFCNGIEMCIDGSCQSGTAPCAATETCDEDTDSCSPLVCTTDLDCDDRDSCTAGTCTDLACVFSEIACEEGTACRAGVCEMVCTVAAECDDGDFCNGAEACVDGFCDAGDPPCIAGESCDECPSTVFFDDFEGGIGNWFADNGIWEVGVPSSGPNAAHSPENVAATVLAGNYPNTNSRLVSPSIQLPAIAAGEEIHLRLWHWFATEPCCDAGVVQIRVETAPGQWDVWADVNRFSGSSGVYTQVLIDLSGYAGEKVQIGFSLSQNGGFNSFPGWYIDDVTIEKF